MSKSRQLATIIANKPMQEMIAVEPGILTILQIASNPEPRENRWIAYEALKRMAQQFVGWDARHKDMRTALHHEMLMEAIDQLLPDSDEETHQWINA